MVTFAAPEEGRAVEFWSADMNIGWATAGGLADRVTVGEASLVDGEWVALIRDEQGGRLVVYRGPWVEDA